MDKLKKVEPDYRRGTPSTRDVCAHQYPNNPNSVVTVIDSSTNGYGMVSTVTRPMDVNSDGNMLVVYRQYAGELQTHGQLGAGYGVVTDGDVQWDVQYNVNYNGNPPWGGGGVGGAGTSQARYPSAIASEEYPYAVWNEYTGNVAGWPADCSSYGGRPYFSYDEFGWGGESWLYPAELDPLYDCVKDLWTGSVAYGYDTSSDEHRVVAVYDDWTRTGNYAFSSEAVEDGYIILGTEQLVVNPDDLGTDGYSSTATLSMNDNGQGLLGIDGIFSGVDMDAGTCDSPASLLTCSKTPMFKLTDNYGGTWYGPNPSFGFYFVPDEVFEDIFEYWPETDVDACTGEVSQITDYWSWYEFDMRVDSEGNPHVVVSIIAESENYFHFLDPVGDNPGTGFYHFTIDRDNLSSPGPVNSATGWNWSYIPLPANDSFNWNRVDGFSYLYGSMCQISVSRDNPDIIYMVGNMANKGEMAAEFDANGDGIEDDPCGTQENPWDLYPEWSEDIWVAKSSDNGTTWTGLENLTQTPRDPNNSGTNNCAPEEQYVHTAHWSDDERVYYQYNQPNWEFNEIGDPTGADHMNRVFLGYSWVEETGVGGCTDSNNCSYDSEAAFDNGSCGNGLYECADGSSGCGCDGVCGDTLTPAAVEDCNGVCNGPSLSICGEICETGYCGDTGICSESGFTAGTCTAINSWTDCDGSACGQNDPLFGCEGLPTCDGGRCYQCEGGNCSGAETSSVDCAACSGLWTVPTDEDTDEDLVTDEGSCENTWVPFVEVGVGCDNVCFCSASEAEVYCAEEGDTDYDASCPAFSNIGYFSSGDGFCDEAASCGDGYCNGDECADTCPEDGCDNACPGEECNLGDLNGDGGYNVLDIVTLANCVLSTSCSGCEGDLNGDGGYNVLDIVTLANCVLSQSCGGRVDDATESKILINDGMVSIEADGFIGGVEMALIHGADFTIDMTNRALFADYLTEGNKTRLLVITPETDQLFSYSGDFKIDEIIVANTQYEVSVSLPLAAEFSLSDAYPNPFNPTTSMALNMPVSSFMKVEVYNVLGQSIETLTSGYKEAGTYNLTWDASNVSSGMYFVKAQAEGFTSIQKLMLVK